MAAFNDLIAQLNLPSIWRGIGWGPFVIEIKNSSGVTINLTGRTVSARTPLFSLGATITDAVNGQVTVQLADTQTKTCPLGMYPYDFTVSGYKSPFFQGYVPVKQPVSVVIT